MPNRDGTGPQGVGPTGLGAGNCEGRQKTRGWGFGRCFRNSFCTLERDDKAVLEAQMKVHQVKLNAIQAKLDDLNKKDS